MVCKIITATDKTPEVFVISVSNESILEKKKSVNFTNFLQKKKKIV